MEIFEILLSLGNHFPKVSASNVSFIRVVKFRNTHDHPRFIRVLGQGGHGGHGGHHKKRTLDLTILSFESFRDHRDHPDHPPLKRGWSSVLLDVTVVTPRLRLHACDFMHFSQISWNRGLDGCYKGQSPTEVKCTVDATGDYAPPTPTPT